MSPIGEPLANLGTLTSSLDSLSSPCTIIARGQPIKLEPNAISSIPFLEVLFAERVQNKKDSEGHFILDIDPSVLPTISHYAQSKQERHLIAALPSKANLSDLLEQFDFLGLSLSYPSLTDLAPDVKHVKDETERIARRTYDTKTADRNAARNAGALLVLGIKSGVYEADTAKSSTDLYHLILFVLSHPVTFGRRMRTRALEVGKESVVLSAKQEAAWMKWVPKKADNAVDLEESSDDQSSGREDGYYDSDDDYY